MGKHCGPDLRAGGPTDRAFSRRFTETPYKGIKDTHETPEAPPGRTRQVPARVSTPPNQAPDLWVAGFFCLTH